MRLTDNSTGGTTFAVTALNDSQAALDLGILATDTNGNGIITGAAINSQINAKSLTNLNGGKGLVAFGGEAFVTLEGDTPLADLFRGAGVTTDGTPLPIWKSWPAMPTTSPFPPRSISTACTTVQDLIDQVDTATGGKVTLAIDGQTLVATDTTGGTGELIIRNANGSSAATELGLNIAAEVDSVAGNNLDPDGDRAGQHPHRHHQLGGQQQQRQPRRLASVQDIIDAINDAGTRRAGRAQPRGHRPLADRHRRRHR